MMDLHLDCSHARLLATELAQCCAPSPLPDLPPGPTSPTTTAFYERLCGSVSALHERQDALVAHGRRLADDSLAAVSAIEEADAHLSTGLDHTDGHADAA